MIAALIGDVHANLPALQAVLAHSAALGASQVWNIGDFVGYGPFPEECVRLLRSTTDVSILGNYDRKVLQIPKKLAQWQDKKHPQKIFAFRWAYEQLSEDSRAYLASLPENRRFTTQGWQVLLTHGSPASRNEHLSPRTPESRLAELAEMTPADVIIFGHSHRPFVRRVGRTWFINTGSVGRPDDGDPRACYALLYLQPDQIGVCHIRLSYDLQATLDAIRDRNLPQAFAAMLANGRSLDALLEAE